MVTLKAHIIDSECGSYEIVKEEIIIARGNYRREEFFDPHTQDYVYTWSAGHNFTNELGARAKRECALLVSAFTDWLKDGKPANQFQPQAPAETRLENP